MYDYTISGTSEDFLILIPEYNSKNVYLLLLWRIVHLTFSILTLACYEILLYEHMQHHPALVMAFPTYFLFIAY